MDTMLAENVSPSQVITSDLCSNSQRLFLVLIEHTLGPRSQQIRHRSHVAFPSAYALPELARKAAAAQRPGPQGLGPLALALFCASSNSRSANPRNSPETRNATTCARSDSLVQRRLQRVSHSEVLRRKDFNSLAFQTVLQDSHHLAIGRTEREKHAWLSSRLHGRAGLFELDPVLKRNRLASFRRDLSSNREFAPAPVRQLEFRLSILHHPNRIGKSWVQKVLDRLDLVQGISSRSVHPYLPGPPIFFDTTGFAFQAYSETHRNLSLFFELVASAGEIAWHPTPTTCRPRPP